MHFDHPVFKVLANNDTGSARGHQAGVVIPKELENYFPDVVGTLTPMTPTADVQVQAELFDGEIYKGTVATRYQVQTWGGTRPPERRLTGQLGPIRDLAAGGDVLIFERSLDDRMLFRIRLVKSGSPAFASLAPSLGRRRWGILHPRAVPLGNIELNNALADVLASETTPFSLFGTRPLTTSTSIRRARNHAFRKRLLEIYSGKCAVTGASLVTPEGSNGVDAAHIVAVEAGGTDDPRNGLLLSKDLHWAFDEGLFVINPTRRVEIHPKASAIPTNNLLRSIAGKAIADADPRPLSAHMSALEWHYKKSMSRRP